MELINRLNELIEEEENNNGDEVAEDLPPEDDDGDTEYKFKMINLNMYKVKKRTTQMSFRITVSG